ncbi:MAG: hypothetical protein IPG04_37995, partial [Polyangiaceae bacterium]|nr:hypothetical protein [Polyangiaceae bacterium]
MHACADVHVGSSTRSRARKARNSGAKRAATKHFKRVRALRLERLSQREVRRRGQRASPTARRKEPDEETGLYYYGARSYAAWLRRWTSADPLGIRPGCTATCATGRLVVATATQAA